VIGEVHSVAEPVGREAELVGLGAQELAERIRRHELSSVEVVEAHIRRMEAVNPALNAVVVPLFDQARAEAVQADRALARGESHGPLHGVPVTIKECHHVAGTCSTAGLESQRGHRAGADAVLVERLRKAGAVVLGKTNVPQFMLYLETDNPVYGRTNNPWNPERTPGGSSGGEAAIIAGGGSPLGLGSDIGGSIRIPAHFAGIAGLKPTAGRLSILGSHDQLLFPGMEAILDAPGPMARNVADLSLAMSVLAAPGLELRDPAIPPVPWRGPENRSMKGLRVGFYTELEGHLPVSPAIRRAVEEAARALEAMGAIVERFAVPDPGEVVELYIALMSAGGVRWARSLVRGGKVDRRIGSLFTLARLPGWLNRSLGAVLEAAGQPHLGAVLKSVRQRTAAEYMELVARKNRYRDRFLAGMGQLDLIVCPPFMSPALAHGDSEYLNALATYIPLYNVLGLPAGVVPATRVRPGEESDRRPSGSLAVKALLRAEQGSAGLPVGVQVVGRYWREDLVLAAMGALEQHFRAQPDYPWTAVSDPFDHRDRPIA
jgi:fatty acid amide hydrolase